MSSVNNITVKYGETFYDRHTVLSPADAPAQDKTYNTTCPKDMVMAEDSHLPVRHHTMARFLVLSIFG